MMECFDYRLCGRDDPGYMLMREICAMIMENEVNDFETLNETALPVQFINRR